MKALRILGRNIRDSFKGVFRNFSLSLASISCITITLLVVGLAMSLNYNVDNIANNVEKDVTIVAFIERETSKEQIDDILERIQKIDGIESYRYKTSTEIGNELGENSSPLRNIISSYTEENTPLLSSYEVKVKDINNIDKIAKELEKIPNIYSVKYGAEMVGRLTSLFDVIRKACIGLVIALIIVTAFLITNTIKITIFSRRKEIDIMRLVGASNLNIKIPFIFEGLILGFLGSIIPMIVTIWGYTSVYKNSNGSAFVKFFKLASPSSFVYLTSFILLVIGMIVGMFGSWAAVRKHLKI